MLAGGVGGAKLAKGMNELKDINLSVIGNIADDDVFHGLWVSPDIDTLTYTLAGTVNSSQGWGLEDETTNALSMLRIFKNETWMMLGDKDFGTHIYRTERRKRGDLPSDIARDIATKLNVKSKILLPSNDIVQTKIKTNLGWLSFQEYFVKEKCSPKVLAVDYQGAETAAANPQCIEAIKNADVIIIAPSNPILSICPILSIKGVKKAIIETDAPTIAVSPLILGKAIKGPAAKIMKALGKQPDAFGVAEYYSDFCECFVLDEKDIKLKNKFDASGYSTYFTDIYMENEQDKARLAQYLVNLYNKCLK
mgnify:CR=1 FL=1